MKKAFSLAEILLTLAIIGVITGLCISIGKQGKETAYNMYYFTSYKALFDATNEAVRGGAVNNRENSIKSILQLDNEGHPVGRSDVTYTFLSNSATITIYKKNIELFHYTATWVSNCGNYYPTEAAVGLDKIAFAEMSVENDQHARHTYSGRQESYQDEKSRTYRDGNFVANYCRGANAIPSQYVPVNPHKLF